MIQVIRRELLKHKDKEADWVKKDKISLSPTEKGDHYEVSCGACHQADGKGLPNMAPTLAGMIGLQVMQNG